MAGAFKEEDEATVLRVYSELQYVSCPLLEGLDLQEAESMLELLCVPSPYRTDVLMWIYGRINPDFNSSKVMKRSKDPDALFKEMAVFGHELMLCRADELGLFKEGGVSVQRQLQFLEELVYCIPREDEAKKPSIRLLGLLDELYSKKDEHISDLLNPTVDPWPTHMKISQKDTQPSSEPIGGDVPDVYALLEEAESALEKLESECEFLDSREDSEEDSYPLFSPAMFEIAAHDLQQLMGTFSQVYEPSQFKKEPTVFSKDPEIFERVHNLLLSLTMERGMQEETVETWASVNEAQNNLRTSPWFQDKEGDSPDDQKKELIECVTRLSSLYLQDEASTNDSGLA